MANRGAARQGAVDPMTRLVELLEGAMNVQAPRDRFKPPRFDGKSDVEIFIAQFNDIAQANQWDQNAALINLRLSLEKDATECSRGLDIPAIFTNLRARFGLTRRQARDKLANLRREPGQSHHMLGVEVQKLVRLAYPTMTANDQSVIAIETIKRSIDNKNLSRHLLAVPADTVEGVTAAADAFFQAGQINSPKIRTNINHIDTCEEDEVNAIDSTTEILTKLLAAVEQNTKIIASLAKQTNANHKNVSRSNSRDREKTTPDGQCYRCGSTYHYIRECPEKPSENLPGPQH
jgi:hypothetical protein